MYNSGMKELFYNGYIEAFDAVIEFLSGVKENPDEEYVVIVPDVYTLEAEKRLIIPRGGSFTINVRSFSRLFHDYCGGETLSKTGAILLVKKIAYDLSEEGKLTCFKYSYRKTGFAKKTYDTISRLREQCVPPEALSCEGMRRHKINDIRAIYAEYLRRTEGKYVDSAGKIELLERYFDSLEGKQNKRYVVFNYDVINKATRSLLRAVDAHSSGVTVFSAHRAPERAASAEITCYRAASEIDEIKETARSIERDIRSGIKADEICVVTEKADFERIKRIFADYYIPFYLSRKIPLSDHPLPRLITSAFDAVYRGYKREDVLEFAANPYVDCSRAEKDDFYAYVCSNLVSYKGFFSPFDETKEYYKGAEKVRKKIAKLLVLLDVSGCKNATESALKIKAALSSVPQIGCEGEVSDERARKSVNEALDAMALALGGAGFEESRDTEKFVTDSVKDLFKSTEFSIVQPRRGVVRIGGLNDFRGQRFGKVYLLDFNEGVLPRHEDDCALLSDRDIAELEKNGKFEFEPKISVLNDRFKDELWQLLQNDCPVFCVYVTADGGKPAFELGEILNDKNVRPYTEVEAIEKLKSENDPRVFASLIGTRDNAVEKIYTIDSRRAENSLYTSVKDTVDGYVYDKNYDLAPRTLAKTSVTALQTFYDCPLRYYMEKTLSVKEFDDGSVKPFDTGTLLHGVIERFLREGKDKSKIDEYFDEELEKLPKAKLEENKAFFDRARKEAAKVCSAAAKQLDYSTYAPVAFEQAFGTGEEGAIAGVKLGSRGETELVGSIDRVDVWNNLARVIDYKTGSERSFSYVSLYYGKKLQLALYSAVMKNNGYGVGGMFILPLSCSWDESKNDNRLGGVFLNSDENLRALDITFTRKQAAQSEVVDKMPYSRDKGTCLASEAGLKNITDYAIRMASNAVDKIESGYAHPTPLEGECEYCAFKGVCERDEHGGERKKEYTESDARKYYKGGGND